MKKYLLIIFLLVLYCFAYSQVYQNQSAPFNFVRGIKQDSISVIPRGCDTVAMPRIKWGAPSIGALYFDTCANTLYARGSFGWVPITGGLDSTNFTSVIDSTGNASFRVLYAAGNKIVGSANMTYDTANNEFIVVRVNTGSAEIDTLYITEPPDVVSNYDPSTDADNFVLLWDINTGKIKTADWAGGSGADTTGLGDLYIRNQQAVQENKRLRIKSALFDSLSASGSGGLTMYSNSGTPVALYGAGGGSGATYYGGVNIDGTTRLATSLTGILKATSGTVATAVSGTDIKTVNGNSLLGSGNISTADLGAWSITGNAGTSPGTISAPGANYIGTSDNHNVSIRQNGINQIYLDGSASFLRMPIKAISGGVYSLTGSTTSTGVSYAGHWFRQTDLAGSTGDLELVAISGSVQSPNTNNGNNSALVLRPTFNMTTGQQVGIDYNPTLTSVNTHYGMLIRSGRVGIGTATPVASALLDLTSTTQGALLPRLTTAQQNAISSPATGLMIWNIDSLSLFQYTGSAWQNVRASGGGSTGITSLNGLTGATQTFATGTSGTDFNISSSGTIHTFNFPNASASNRGLLTSADWTTFNNKQNSIDTLTGTLLADVSMPSNATWYSGPSVTLTVGTWQLIGNITVGGTTTGYGDCRLFDGTNAVGAGNYQIIAGRSSSAGAIALVIVASGTTTVTLQGYNSVTGGTIKAASALVTQAGASRIIALKIK